MNKYSTKQREELMTFFENNPDKQFSTIQILEHLNNADISQSSVYRNLSDLEKEGIITRAVKEGCRESIYQYINADSCQDAIHLACTKCGKIKHMDSNYADDIKNTVLLNDGFDISKTIMYGICDECKKVKGEKDE